MSSTANAIIEAGNAAYRAGRYHQAIDFGRQAVALDPGNPWAHNLLGAACAEEMEFAEARRAFAAAVLAGPDIAVSRVNHSYALILDGAFEEAEAELMTALTLDPASGAAFLNLSWIHKASLGDPLIARIETLRQRTQDVQARILYAFSLGKFYDDVGDYDRAFACFREGNDLSSVRCDIAAHARLAEAIQRSFSAAFMQEIKKAGFPGDKAVFIIGMPRSGSSLLEDRLARHPLIGALGERPDVNRIVNLITANHPQGRRYPDWVPELPMSAFARFGRHYVETMESKSPGAARLIDKNLLNFRFLGLIKGMLTNATILHCRRNPIDTCLSCYFQFLRPDHDYKFSLESLGRYYRLYSEMVSHWANVIGGIHLFEYEKFIADPEQEYARALAALRLDAPSAERSAAARSIQTSSAYQVRQPVTGGSINRWRNYEKHLQPLIDALGDLAKPSG